MTMNKEEKKQQQDQQQKNEGKVSVDIPNVLFLNIVSQLPVDSLIRFRCLSKFWYYFLTSPNFVKLHLNRSIADKKLSLMIRTSNQEFYSIDSDAYSSAIESNTEVEYDQYKLCNNYASSKMEILGCCHGIILMSMSDSSDLCLLNLCTRESIKLRSPVRVSTCKLRYCIYGFGCDSDLDDYRVIQIRWIWLPDTGDELEVMVHSLQENCWRTVGTNTAEIISFLSQVRFAVGSFPTFLSGRVHWIGCRVSGVRALWRIMAFDFGIEEFREIPVPDIEDVEVFGYVVARLGVLRECLSMVRYFSLSSHIEIFLMKEYGVGNSWCKLYSISGSIVNSSVSSGNSAYWFILCYTNDGRLLVQVDCTKLCLYDPETKLLEDLKLHPRFQEILQDKEFSMLTSIPSLVSLGRR